MKKVMLFFLSLAITIQCSSAQEQSINKSESIQKIFDYLTKNALYNGVVLVVDNGQVLYKNAFGYSNFEWQIPNTIDAKFEIGSISKQFTAMLIMQLLSENKLNLSDKVSKYIPDPPKTYADKVTIHHLLTHTSGIPNYAFFPNYLKQKSKTISKKSELLNLIIKHELQFEPGTSWNYSNSGYFLLGMIVEKITGISLEENYTNRIFKPLGMTNSGAMDDCKILCDRAYGYEKDWNDTFEIPEYLKKSNVTLAESGLYSTLYDLLKWHQGLLTNKILEEKFKKIYFNKHFPFSDTSGYSYGYYYSTYSIDDTNSVKVLYHPGSIPGTTCMIMRIPECNQCILLFDNSGMARETSLLSICYVLVDILYDKRFKKPELALLDAMLYTSIFKNKERIRNKYTYLKKFKNNIYKFNPKQLSNLGNALFSLLNMPQKAEIVFQLNIEEYPDEFSVYYDLGRFYTNNNQNDLAIEYLKKALSLSEDNEDVKKLINHILNQENNK